MKYENIEFMKKLWIETVEFILEKGYRVSYIAYTNEKIINSSDFGNLYENLRNRGLSSTDVLFIPYQNKLNNYPTGLYKWLQ